MESTKKWEPAPLTILSDLKGLDIAEHQAKLDVFLRKRKASFLESPKKTLAATQELKEKQKRLRLEIMKCQEQIQTLEQKLPEAKNKMKTLSEEVNSYKQQEHKLQTQKQEATNRRDELLAKVQDLQSKARNDTSDAQRQLDLSELAANMEYSKFKIIQAGEDCIQFEFQCINEKDWDRVYSFTTNILPSGDYSVTECTPPLDTMDALVKQLNKDRDLYHFIKLVRKTFCEHALNE